MSDDFKNKSHIVSHITSMTKLNPKEGDVCFVNSSRAVFIRRRDMWVQVTEFDPEVQKEMNEVFSRESMKDICD